jgi:hypothetical protein
MDDSRTVQIHLSGLNLERNPCGAGMLRAEKEPVHKTLSLIHRKVVKGPSVLNKRAHNPLKRQIECNGETHDENKIGHQLWNRWQLFGLF